MTQGILFSEKMKLVDLIHVNYRLLLVLPRFGIKLGFGDKNVAEVCRRHDVPLHLFLLVCNVFTFDEYWPGKAELSSFPVDGLIRYLHNSHDYYSSDRIPKIYAELEELTVQFEERQHKLLIRFLDDYRNEVVNHLNYEETVVFPYIRQLLAGEQPKSYHIDQFEENHSNIEDKLNDLKNIIIKYLPNNCSEDLQTDLLFNLFLLEDDLNKHNQIEDRILVPLVEQLEKRSL